MIAAPSPLAVSHARPPTAGADRTEKWLDGQSFDTFLESATHHVALWTGVYRHARIPVEMTDRVAALGEDLKLLILSADWCGDACNIVPVIQRLVDQSPNLNLRLLERDEHLDLMDEHRTGGTARAIPAVIMLDEQNVERAWWGPRPSAAQAWVITEGFKLDSEERYRELRKWYARDKGRMALDEIVSLLEGIAGEPHR